MGFKDSIPTVYRCVKNGNAIILLPNKNRCEEQIESDGENEIFSANKRKLNDFNEKMRLAKNLVAAIKDGKNITENISGSLGIPIEVFIEEEQKVKERRTFQKQLGNRQINFKLPEEAVREFLIVNYLNNQTVPSMTEFFRFIQKKTKFSKKYLQENECEHKFQIFRQLKKQGFVMKRLPKTDRFIFMEDAKHLATRMRYLEIIRDQRQMKKNLVYVSKLTTGYAQYLYVAASPSQGVISACDSSTSDEWFDKILLPLLPPSSVVIIDGTIDLDHKIITTNVDSNKNEMLKFLDFKDIPHRHTMHRAELYELIVKHKKLHSSNASNLEEVAKVYDCETIILPSDLPDLNYFNQLVQFFVSKTTLSVNSLSQIEQSVWESFETILISNEDKIYEKDMQMELFIDNLMTMATNEKLTEKDMGPDVNEGLFKTIIDCEEIFK